jgi:hypothetical protein
MAMRKIIYTMTLMLVGIWLLGCSYVGEQVKAENDRYKITSVEKEGSLVLCSYDKKTGERKELLRTSPDIRPCPRGFPNALLCEGRDRSCP